MAILDIFKRKKKEEFVPFEAMPGQMPSYGPAGYPSAAMPEPSGAGLPPMPELPSLEPSGALQPPQPTPQAMPISPGYIENLRTQLEALNYKLDTLKAVLDSINSKLANIETALKASPLEKGEGWTY
jgi:hypothetical protein